MQQIWTNPSLQRSFIQVTGISKADFINVLKLSLTNNESTTNPASDIIIFPNMEYNFIFYDATLGSLYSITGLVEDVYEDQIKIKYLKDNTNNNYQCNCNKNNNKNTSPMPTCNCILNPPDVSKYEGPGVIFIPIMNLVSVTYVKSHNKPNKRNGGVHVMLLGISATTVKAIIVRLAFFEDSIEDAIKYVDLKAENIYDLTYESNNGAIYESRAKVIAIEEVDPNESTCKPGKGYVREHVGCHNSVYVNNCCSKDEFMVAPPVKKVKIIVDTSESFTGRYEVIMLDSIRDCVLVYDASGNDNTNADNSMKDYCNDCCYKTTNCNPNSCGHYLPPIVNTCCSCNSAKSYTYNYDNCKAIVTGDKVDITIDGNTSKVDLDVILKYYLCVD